MFEAQRNAGGMSKGQGGEGEKGGGGKKKVDAPIMFLVHIEGQSKRRSGAR